MPSNKSHTHTHTQRQRGRKRREKEEEEAPECAAHKPKEKKQKPPKKTILLALKKEKTGHIFASLFQPPNICFAFQRYVNIIQVCVNGSLISICKKAHCARPTKQRYPIHPRTKHITEKGKAYFSFPSSTPHIYFYLYVHAVFVCVCVKFLSAWLAHGPARTFSFLPPSPTATT